MNNEGSNNIFGVDMGEQNNPATSAMNSLNNFQPLKGVPPVSNTSSIKNSDSISQVNPSQLNSAQNIGVEQQQIINNQPLPTSQSDLKASGVETQSLPSPQPSEMKPQPVSNQSTVPIQESPIFPVDNSSLSEETTVQSSNIPNQPQPTVLPTGQESSVEQSEPIIQFQQPVVPSKPTTDINDVVQQNNSLLNDQGNSQPSPANESVVNSNIPFEVPINNSSNNLNNSNIPNQMSQNPNNFEQNAINNNNGNIPPVSNNNQSNNIDKKKKSPIKLIIIISATVLFLILVAVLIIKLTNKEEEDSDFAETEQITCSKTSDNTTEEYIFEFDLEDKSLLSSYMDKSISYEGDGTSILDELTKEQQTLSNGGIDADISEGDNIYFLTYSADADIYQQYYSDKQLTTKEQINTEYTNQGYTCE